MAFDPATFAAVARALKDLPIDKEGRARTMWGRAYYSLHLAVRKAVCMAHGASPDTKVDHGRLISELYRVSNSGGDAKLGGLAKQLEDLYRRRQAADYKLDPLPKDVLPLQQPAVADHESRAVLATIAALGALDFSLVQLDRIK